MVSPSGHICFGFLPNIPIYLGMCLVNFSHSPSSFFFNHSLMSTCPVIFSVVLALEGRFARYLPHTLHPQQLLFGSLLPYLKVVLGRVCCSLPYVLIMSLHILLKYYRITTGLLKNNRQINKPLKARHCLIHF